MLSQTTALSVPARLVASGPFLMALSMVLWLVVELIAAEPMRRVGIPQLVWLRYLFHFLFMFLCIAPVAGLGFVWTSRPWLQLARSLLMLAMPLCYWMGISAGRSRDVLGLFWSAPLFVLAFAVFARDRFSVGTVVAAAVGWLGALAIYRPALGSLGDSLMWGLGMAASFSLYLILTAVLDRTEGVLTNLFWSAVGVFAVLSFFLPVFWHPIDLDSLWVIAAVGVLGWFTLALLDLALRRAPPSRLAAFLLLQPVCHVLLQLAAGRNAPGLMEIVGSLLIVGAMGLGLLHPRRALRERDARLG